MTSISDEQFIDIRPYNDDEVAGVLARLKSDRALADNLAKLRLPRLKVAAPWVARWLITQWVRWKLRGVETVAKFQQLVEPQLQRQIAATADFSSSGLENLSANESYLFISNHRDIAMDPAFTNYALFSSGHRTCSVAIGDNLLRESWIADLMRINKSFIVKRNIKAPKELFAASRQLAKFIRYTISENQGPVWIAQREGRAKNGCDATEPAVIKMLSLSQDRKLESIEDALASLNIVPLAISYELDPCDGAKAAELAGGADYTKADDEDVQSIGLGIAGQKGRVHLEFGAPLMGEQLDVATVVAAIDKHVARGYRLFETNLWAWQRLEDTASQPPVAVYPGTVSRAAFDARIDALPETHRMLALEMYANPLRVALKSACGSQ